MSVFTLANYFQFSLIHGPNIPGSYATLFFTALDFTFTTRYLHTWVLFLLWLSLLILSGAMSPLFSSSILASTNLGSSSFSVLSFCLFIPFMGFTRPEYWSGLLFLLQWTVFCQNSPSWPIHLEWPCMAWLIASLNYTRLWFLWSFWLASVIVVFILSAFWWKRIRSLWKLPDGKDWLWGKLSLALVGRAMLSKSLIQV